MFHAINLVTHSIITIYNVVCSINSCIKYFISIVVNESFYSKLLTNLHNACILFKES